MSNMDANLKQVYSDAIKDITPSKKPQSIFKKLFRKLKKDATKPIPTLKQIPPK